MDGKRTKTPLVDYNLVNYPPVVPFFLITTIFPSATDIRISWTTDANLEKDEQGPGPIYSSTTE